MPDFNPLPERDNNQLLTAVRDMMHNGGNIPQDVSNRLIMAAILELNTCIAANANLARKNAIGLRWLGAGFSLLAVIIVALHSESSEILGAIARIFGP
jgi:hypothetical protein